MTWRDELREKASAWTAEEEAQQEEEEEQEDEEEEAKRRRRKGQRRLWKERTEANEEIRERMLSSRGGSEKQCGKPTVRWATHDKPVTESCRRSEGHTGACWSV